MSYSFTVVPRELVWQAQDAHARTVTLHNTGTETFTVEVIAPPIVDLHHFDWSHQPRLELMPGKQFSLSVRPPVPGPGTGPATEDVVFTLRYLQSDTVYQTYPVRCRNDGMARINYGDVAISTINFDPAGGDLDGEGEYVDVVNVSGRALDFAQSTLSQIVFSHRGPYKADFRPFEADPRRIDFGRTCLLAPGATLRVLTGRPPAADPNGATRFYLGLGNPIWNNTGDRVTLANEWGEMVATFGYLSQGRDPNLPVPPNPSDPGGGAPQTVFKVFTVRVDPQAQYGTVMMDGNEEFMLADGDTVTIATDEANIMGEYLATNNVLPGTAGFAFLSPEFVPSGRRLIFPNRQGAAENTSPSDPGYPLPGAPYGALLGSTDFGQGYFVVGGGTRFRVTADRPHPLTLAVNDNYWGDNRGAYIATVTIER